MHTRRTFLGAAVLGAALGCTPPPTAARRILVLGGTRFVGRHIVAEALARGHAVTLFNRGKTNPHLFPEAERILGDRAGDHAELRGRRWDVAIDTSGVEPDQVERACTALAGAVDRYVFTSSSAAYEVDPDPFTEDHPLRPWPTTRPANYGEKKARCEQIVADHFSARLVARPVVLVGPHDPRPRFLFWPLRAREGGEFLAPGSPDLPAPLADARDLATWLVGQLERGATGVFNVAGSATMADLIAAALTHGQATPVWVDNEWLYAQKATYDSLPSMHRSGYHAITATRARAEGLTLRSVAASMADAVAWWDGEPPQERRGISRAREQELLAAWRARG